MNLVVKNFFDLILINRSRGIKYQFLKKIHDVVNKVYAFKFGNLRIFIAFPSPSMETETKFSFFQSDLAAKRSWWPISFIAYFDVTHENVLLCEIFWKVYVIVIYVFLTLIESVSEGFPTYSNINLAPSL